VSFDYVTPTGAIRKIGAPLDVERFVSAMRAKDAVRPVRTAPAARRQSLDGTPCPRCGASGYADCAHQIAAPRPVAAAKPIPDPVRWTPNGHATASVADCHAVLSELEALMVAYDLTRADICRLLRRNDSGQSGLFTTLEECRARQLTIQKIREFIRTYGEA